MIKIILLLALLLNSLMNFKIEKVGNETTITIADTKYRYYDEMIK